MRRLLIIAGSGVLPYYVAEVSRSKNDDPVVAVISNECSCDWSGFEYHNVSLGDFCALRLILRQYDIGRIVIAGAVSQRCKIKDLRFSIKDSFKIPKLIWNLILGGDAALLTGVISFLESYGISVIGAHEIVPEFLAHMGPMGVCIPHKDDERDIFSAMNAADVLCKLDIGQSAVSVGGRVVALEGVEGTDFMLERIIDGKKNSKILPNKSGVLVKMCKLQQDIRADLPSIGLLTIQNAIKANLSGISLEAGKSFVLEKEAVIQAANEAGIFIYGINREFKI
ncbi:MAG: DUF1009 domain-containing protein [Candidatus Liberibacter ctenarytainae]|uniref:DUF1009 domain-containing protein n=1 Tax=Candidatus Liberibacter ctenarytainae TaxID=2020335 RepID=A0A937AKZ8_9HYPH|nr:DUF1009 domain-containing protein [Candidatus Liberibacter ctenarytainae]